MFYFKAVHMFEGGFHPLFIQIENPYNESEFPIALAKQRAHVKVSRQLPEYEITEISLEEYLAGKDEPRI